MLPSDAYQAGRKACFQEKNRRTNPHCAGTPLFSAWQQGWEDANREIETSSCPYCRTAVTVDRQKVNGIRALDGLGCAFCTGV